MSACPTRHKIKHVCNGLTPFEGEIDPMIQEVQDRLYDAGIAPGSRSEVEIDFATDRVEWSGYQVVMLPVVGYDGLAGVRDNCKPRSRCSWKVRDIEAEHQQPGSSYEYFVDHGIHEVDGEKKRIYQVPDCLRQKEEVYRFLLKVQSPFIEDDSSEVRVPNIYVAKLGLLAVGYQNEGDARAPQAMQDFLGNANQSHQRGDGVKTRYIGLDLGLRHRPTNRM